ncbi:hypothetical protein FRC11_014750, partial [Ceratobasidium sp. 423]
EHDHIVNWIDKWVAAIKQHTEILSQMSLEQKNGLAQPIIQPSSNDSDGGNSSGSDSGLDLDSDSGDSNSHLPPISALSHSPLHPLTSVPGPSVAPSELLPGPSKQAKGKQPQQAHQVTRYDSDDKSNGPASDIDFEAMDVMSQDEKLSDKDWDYFNDRHLNDNVFPSDYPVGLCEQYGFNVEVEFHIHDACAPYEEVMPEDLWGPGKNKPLFGGFLELKPYQALCLSCPDTVMHQLIALRVVADQTKWRWELYNWENPQFRSDLWKWAKTQPSILPEDLQPLLQLLLTCIMSWLRAKAMAPYMYGHWMAMNYTLHKAINLFITSKCLINTSDFPNPEFTAEDLIDQVNKTKLQVVELSFICMELGDWYKLLATFMEKLCSNWLIWAIPLLRDIIKIVEGIYEWIDMVCPTNCEEPKGLQDALEVACKMDPSLVLTGKVVPTSSSTPATTIETSPANEPAPTIESTPNSPGNVVEGEQAMDLDPLILVTSIPLTLPIPQDRPKPKATSKLYTTHTSEPHDVEPAQVVELTPIIEPIQLALVFEPTPIGEPIQAPLIAESGSNLLVNLAPEGMVVDLHDDVGAMGT